MHCDENQVRMPGEDAPLRVVPKLTEKKSSINWHLYYSFTPIDLFTSLNIVPFFMFSVLLIRQGIFCQFF